MTHYCLDFGWLDDAVNSGEMTEEEANEIACIAYDIIFEDKDQTFWSSLGGLECIEQIEFLRVRGTLTII